MIDSLYPVISYEDVESMYIRQQIHERSFYDIEYRQFVNSLISVEWFARNGYPENCTGLSASGISYNDALVALKYPSAYDRVRAEFRKPTRAEQTICQDRNEDLELRHAWARRHRTEWQAVARGETYTDDSEVADVPIDDRGRFNWFRFPEIPYTSVESTFIQDEICDGSFDDYEHRQYVNQLVFVERWLREGLKSVKHSYYHPIRAYRVAGKVPDGFHILRTEFDQEAIQPFDSRERERDQQDEQRYRDSWQTVQETDQNND
ncbi:hypothetical protein [Halapricum desulfuricans]|uniref:Uncharacterized protein n=1 Tax=Halapricum desulfuricans TaxID=2841257 RepID=A0A897NAW4_9EURY|nr:hypothetical protein [Halapricum desulfuricans]QSG09584.1 hypothetical protein HSR122_2203 [Halapricum desulfuricans]